MTMRLHRADALAAIALLIVGISYIGSVQNGFVWDDWYLFIHNPSLRTGTLTWAALASPVLEGTTYFRPFVFLSFWAEFQIFGVDASRSHAVNLGLHMFNVLLVYFLARNICTVRNLSSSEARSLLAAVLYGVHPSLVESVAWVSGRFDLLATTFTLLALFADAAFRSPAKRAFALAFLFAGALGSKEVAVALPPLLVVHRMILEDRPNESVGQAIRRILSGNMGCVIALAAVFAVYVVLRYVSFGAVIHEARTISGLKNTLGDRTFLVLGTFVFYVKEILYPFTSVGPLHPLQPELIKPPAGIANLIASSALIGALVLSGKRKHVVSLLLIGSLFCLLPVLNIVPLTIANNVGHDRFLTLPLAFCAISIATAIGAWKNTSVPKLGLVAPSLILFGWIVSAALITHVSVKQWRSDISLWTWAYRLYPDSLYAQGQIASSVIGARRFDIADRLYSRFLRNGPMDADLQLNYGGLLIAKGEIDEGRNYIKGALLAFPPLHTMSPAERSRYAYAANNSMNVAFGHRLLAIADMEQAQFDAALKNSEISLWYKPNYPAFLTIKAFALLGLERLDEADTFLQRAIELDLPENAERIRNGRTKFVADVCAKWAEKLKVLCPE